MSKNQKVKITPRAALQRINRVLAPDRILKKSRGDGSFFVIDRKRNCVVHQDIDLDAYGKKLDVIQQWEAVDNG